MPVDVWTMGELLVEVMRPRAGIALGETGPFVGPFPSGAPGIFIDTVARLGRTAAIASGVGDDEFGSAILDRLRRDGVNTDCVSIVPGRSTGVAFVTYLRDGSRRFIFHWDGTPAVMGEAPGAEAIEGTKFFHMMGCSLMANDAFRARLFDAAELFASRGAEVTLDPNIRFELLRDRGVDTMLGPVLARSRILFPGERELELLAGEPGGRGDGCDAAASALFRRLRLRLIVLKRGSRGCSVYDGERRNDVPAFRVREVDPTGAGDCFDAGFLCGLLDGREPREAARVAAAAGALNAKAFGPMEGEINPRAVERLLRRG